MPATLSPLLQTAHQQQLKEEFDWELPDEKLNYAPRDEAHAVSTYRNRQATSDGCGVRSMLGSG
jgi:hypothetical protein